MHICLFFFVKKKITHIRKDNSQQIPSSLTTTNILFNYIVCGSMYNCRPKGNMLKPIHDNVSLFSLV